MTVIEVGDILVTDTGERAEVLSCEEKEQICSAVVKFGKHGKSVRVFDVAWRLQHGWKIEEQS